jgi:hypothetical protein
MPKVFKFIRKAIKVAALLDAVLDQFELEKAKRQAKYGKTDWT